eukprot:g7376.t1
MENSVQEAVIYTRSLLKFFYVNISNWFMRQYDRVKSTIEELRFIKRARFNKRARFIDDSEAQLTQKDIERIDAAIGRGPYVLFPKDEDLTEEMKMWQGRVKTIKGSTKRMIKESQNKVMDQTKEDISEIKRIITKHGTNKVEIDD